MYDEKGQNKKLIGSLYIPIQSPSYFAGVKIVDDLRRLLGETAENRVKEFLVVHQSRRVEEVIAQRETPFGIILISGV